MQRLTQESELMIFHGNGCPELAREIADHVGAPISRAAVGRFSDGEVMVELLENVRGKDTFVIQSTSAPSQDNLMELLVMVDALKRSSARRVTAVLPYMGYSRQDRRPRSSRTPITAKVNAKMIAAAGTDRVLTVDIHADQILGFYDIPIDNIYASPLLLGDIWRHHYDPLIVVSPDVGGVVRARSFAKRLDDADLAIIDKRRPKANECEVMNIIGDVEGKNCIVMDDMVDTAGTLCNAAAALKDKGAIKVVAYASHPVLSGPAIENINKSCLDELVVTNTIPLSDDAKLSKRIRSLSVAELLGESIQRVHREISVSSLFMD